MRAPQQERTPPQEQVRVLPQERVQALPWEQVQALLQEREEEREWVACPMLLVEELLVVLAA